MKYVTVALRQSHADWLEKIANRLAAGCFGWRHAPGSALSRVYTRSTVMQLEKSGQKTKLVTKGLSSTSWLITDVERVLDVGWILQSCNTTSGCEGLRTPQDRRLCLATGLTSQNPQIRVHAGCLNSGWSFADHYPQGPSTNTTRTLGF